MVVVESTVSQKDTSRQEGKSLDIDERLILLISALPDDKKIEVETYLKAIIEKVISVS